MPIFIQSATGILRTEALSDRQKTEVLKLLQAAINKIRNFSTKTVLLARKRGREPLI